MSQQTASLTSCPEAAFDVAYHRCLVAHYRHDADENKSGKPKGTCTGLGQINAAAFNIRPSVRDRDRDGITTLLVGDLDLGTKGQRFVRRRHGVVVERDAAGGFGSKLRRVSHGVHRCDTVFGKNWNVEQTQNTSAAINRRMRDPRFSWLDAPRGELKIRGVAAECCCKRAIIADQTCSGSVGS